MGGPVVNSSLTNAWALRWSRGGGVAAYACAGRRRVRAAAPGPGFLFDPRAHPRTHLPTTRFRPVRRLVKRPVKRTSFEGRAPRPGS